MIRIEQIDKSKLKGIELVEPTVGKFEWLIEGSVSLAAYDDDVFLGCCGIAPSEKGWVSWASYAKGTAMSSFKLARATYDAFGIMKASVSEDIYSHVVEGFKLGERLVKFLGFKKNGKQITNDGIIYNEYELCRKS
jgi:hypothetical protein